MCISADIHKLTITQNSPCLIQQMKYQKIGRWNLIDSWAEKNVQLIFREELNKMTLRTSEKLSQVNSFICTAS